MNSTDLFIGIDLAKAQVDLAVRPTGETRTSPTDEAGLAALVQRLQPLRPTLIVLEATGGWEIPLAGALATAGLPVAVVNPRRVRACAKATGCQRSPEIPPVRSREIPPSVDEWVV